METKEKLLLQHNTYTGFYSEMNTSLKYMGKFNSAVFCVVQCLSSALIPFLLALQKFKINKELYSLSLGVFITLFVF